MARPSRASCSSARSRTRTRECERARRQGAQPQLEAYTKATEAAAKEAGVAFVDLFHPSLELFKAAKEPLTINGVHLTADGNRQLAEVIAKACSASKVSASPSMEALREAVVDKRLPLVSALSRQRWQ
jgi:hypothetical protein